MIESLDSQARARSISSFNLATKRFQLVSLEPLAKGTYKGLQSHQWRISQVELDTTDLPPEDEVSMDMGTNNIVFNKYVKVVAELDKHLVKGLWTKNQLLNSQVKILEGKKQRLQMFVAKTGQITQNST